MNEVERLNILNQYGILDTPHEEPFERIAALAREIAPLVGADADEAEQAARLAAG